MYADDIILIGDYEDELIKLKTLSMRTGKSKISQSRKRISISQRIYVLDFLKETEMLGCNSVENT